MGCGCGKRPSASRSVAYTYGYTPPDGGEEIPYLTAIEAKIVQRNNRGGTIRRIDPSDDASSSDKVAAS